MAIDPDEDEEETLESGDLDDLAAAAPLAPEPAPELDYDDDDFDDDFDIDFDETADEEFERELQGLDDYPDIAEDAGGSGDDDEDLPEGLEEEFE